MYWSGVYTPIIYTYILIDILFIKINNIWSPLVFNINLFFCFISVYFDVHGCQMNVNDTEIVWSILKSAGFAKTDTLDKADVILVMTCAIREGAETKIWNKLFSSLRALKKKRLKEVDKPAVKIGVLGLYFLFIVHC